MKWYDNKKEEFSRKKRGIHGRKNNYKFNIKEHTKGFEYKHLGWYILVEDIKTNNNYNSLWDNLWFEDIENAKKWCKEYAEENKKDRIEE